MSEHPPRIIGYYTRYVGMKQYSTDQIYYI